MKVKHDIDAKEEKRIRNKENFLNELFYGNSESKSTIATEVLHLLSVLPSNYSTAFSELGWLKDAAKEYEKYPTKKSLHSINQTLQNRKLISKLNISAFITVTSTLDKYLQYKALTLLVIARLSLIGEHRSKINALSNELRQYAQTNRKLLEPYLPSLNEYDIKNLIQTLTDTIEDEINTPKQQRQQLACFRNPLRDCYLERNGIHRNMGPREFKCGRTLTTSRTQKLDDTSEETLIQVAEISTGIKGKSSWQIEESLEPERTLSLVSSPHFVSRDRNINMMHARSINSAIMKSGMLLTCSINHVSKGEITLLIKRWISDLNCPKNSEHAKALILILMTGNTLEEVKKWTTAKNTITNSTIGVKRNFKLPSHKKIESDLSFLYSAIEIDYVLPLPLNVVSNLTSFRFRSVNDTNLKVYLSTIKKGTTLSSISRYMKQYLTSEGVDICLIELINGHDPQNAPARFYTQIHYYDLLCTFKSYHQHLVSLSDSLDLTDVEQLRTSTLLGSPLYLNTHILKDVFAFFQTHLDHTNKEPHEQFSPAHHNLRVIQLQLLLGIVSGHRPVVDWFGTFNDIHFTTGEYRIADKERALDYSGRVIVIPDIVINKIQEYKAYCESAITFHANRSPDHSLRFKQAFDGDAAFCFYIEDDELEATKPSTYAAQIDQILPLQPNWTRHYLRSYLHEQGFSDELSAAWLGHKHANQLPFHQFSQLSRQHLDDIAQNLQQHISMLLGVTNA